MNNPSSDGIHLNKDYSKGHREQTYCGFAPTDLQWEVSKVDDDFTLYDLFRLVYQAEIAVPGIAAAFGMSEFESFWDQINLDRDQDDENDMTHLELYWSPDYNVRTTKKTGKPTDQSPCGLDENYWDNPKKAEMPNLMSFHGIGPGCSMKDLDFHKCGDDCSKITAYAIEFTHVNNLKHLPIRVLPNVKFYPPYIETDREFLRTGFQLTIYPTLWCFITSVFWELTFAGFTPDEISDKRQDLSDKVKDAKKQLGNDTNAC